MFPSLLKQQKWFKYKRDAKIGDIVLRKDETAAGQLINMRGSPRYKLGQMAR